MNIAFFGSSLVSSYWNGAATYYRGIVKGLAERGHKITFYEPDAYERQQHRDMEDPPWATVVVYPPEEAAALRCVEAARGADVVVKASGVGIFDELLEAAIPGHATSRNTTIFWDVDAPATLDRLAGNPADPFHEQVSRYHLIFTYGGGAPVVNAYLQAGARRCIPVYNALDPTTHYPVPPDPRFQADLSFLGNRLPDRERRVEQFFLEPAAKLPGKRFLLGGAGWGDKPVTPNMRWFDHVYTRDHNAFNCTPRAVINISRDSMARYGFSPATRVFEAAGAAACLITDKWEGIEEFLEPDSEILVAADGDDVVNHVNALTEERSRAIGRAARERILHHHTYAHRAAQVEQVLA